MTRKRTALASNIEINLEEVNTVENFISELLTEDNFYKLNSAFKTEETEQYSFFNTGENIEFIAINKDALNPYSNTITEKEFFRIVGVNKTGFSKRSGKYQESLYSHYIRAVAENDLGYVSDILNKAMVFENNLNYVKMLMKDKTFMKEWRKNFGKESPLNVFKHSGNLRKINIIHERK